MERHVMELAEKARTHTVYASDGCSFVVESGSGGALYRVRELATGMHYSCTCAWQWHNPNSECSHVLAVRLYKQR